jgi:aminopeptidase YwaD
MSRWLRASLKVCATSVAFVAVTAQAPRLGSGQAPDSLPAGAERAYKAIKDRVDGNAAMDVVRFMDPYWRISGNPGFNASVDHIRDGLQAAGVTNRVEEFSPRQGSGQAPRGRGWDYQAGTVSFADTGEVLLSRERDRVSLCINSFSTPGVIEAPLVDVGDATPADYAGKDVKGAVVLGRAAAGQLWQQAVKARGAVGVISTAVAPYIRPEDPATFAFPDQWDVFQWGSVPYDETAKAFGFKASLRAAGKMRERMKAGPF